jgi:hypothetical protein
MARLQEIFFERGVIELLHESRPAKVASARSSVKRHYRTSSTTLAARADSCGGPDAAQAPFAEYPWGGGGTQAK